MSNTTWLIVVVAVAVLSLCAACILQQRRRRAVAREAWTANEQLKTRPLIRETAPPVYQNTWRNTDIENPAPPPYVPSTAAVINSTPRNLRRTPVPEYNPLA